MTAINSFRGLIIAAPSSRAGKTTVALGLIRALSRRGHIVQSFKSGPDYIDAAFHKSASKRPCINLDSYAMGKHTLQALIAGGAHDTDISIVEGAMGLFDGAPSRGQFATGATGDIAALTGWPVILVVDVARQAATAAAIVKGCATYRDDVTICAVILNNVASPRHEELVKGPIESLGIPVVASIKRNCKITLPERHLGLVQADETQTLENVIDACANAIEQSANLNAITNLAIPAKIDPGIEGACGASGPLALPPPGQRIALAHDNAFSFMYPHMAESWRTHGAELFPFSPLADEAPAPDADAVWLPGGYPELHAGKLADAKCFRNGMRQHAQISTPIHGECGGYMVLGNGIEDKNGARHEMLGLLNLETTFATRKLHLGYRKSIITQACAIGNKGDTLFGHEFHYATIISNNDPPFADDFDAQGAAINASGSQRGNVTGTFFHLIDKQTDTKTV